MKKYSLIIGLLMTIVINVSCDSNEKPEGALAYYDGPYFSEVTNLFDQYLTYLKDENYEELRKLEVKWPDNDYEDFTFDDSMPSMHEGSMLLVTDLLFNESEQYQVIDYEVSDMYGGEWLVLTAEFMFHDEWWPAEFWFMEIDGKIGMGNFDINW